MAHCFLFLVAVRLIQSKEWMMGNAPTVMLPDSSYKVTLIFLQEENSGEASKHCGEDAVFFCNECG